MLLGAFFASFVFVICLFSHFTSASNTNEVTTASSAGVNYENADQGAWKIKKTARIIDNNNVQLTLNVDTILKGNNRAKDVLIMLDTSGSMTTDRINQAKNAIRSLGSGLLGTSYNNRIAVKAFNTFVYDVTPGFQADKTMFNLYLHDNMPNAQGGTNYYDAILKIGEFLESYQPQDERDMIVVFITDGRPIENHPAEVSEFRVLEQNYPNVTFQGIQYEMGDEIIDELAAVSSNQFAANVSTIEDVLYEAVSDGVKYGQFVLTDVINGDYYEVISTSASKGTILASDNTVTWNMDGIIRSGSKQSATIDLRVKQGCHNKDDSRCPVSQSTNVKTKLNGLPDENVSFAETPILQFRYTVHYNANLPSGCEVSGAVPADANHLISETVALSDSTLSCAGYSFRGWTIATNNTVRYNDNYFLMPAADVEIRALWSKVSIEKSMDGTIKPKTTATFKSLQSTGSNQYRNPFRGYYLSDSNLNSMSDVYAIKITDTLPTDFTPSVANTFSASDSELPIYGYYDPANHTYYFYSDADEIYLNTYAEGFFSNFYNLTDISDLSQIHTENATSLANLFVTSSKLTDISAISGWDTSNVTNMNGMLNDTRVANLEAIEDWNIDSLTSLSGTFANNPSLADVSHIADWDVSNVTTMSGIFSGDTGLTSLADLSEWETGSVRSLASAFSGMTKLNTLDGISEWDVSNVADMGSIFLGDTKISSLSQLSGWTTSSLTNLNAAFQDMAALTSADGLDDWDVDQVTNMSYMFYNCTALLSVSDLAGWTTSSLTNLESTFMKTSKLNDTTGLEGWDVSGLSSLVRTFQESGIKNVNGLADWNTEKVTSMLQTFAWCSSLANIDGLADWDVLKVSTMEGTFRNTSFSSPAALAGWFVYPDNTTPSLTSLRNTFSGSKIVDLDGLDDWNTSRVTTMNAIFGDCTLLVDLSGLADWDLTRVTTLSYAFANTAIITTEPLAGWGKTLYALNTLEETFKNCKSLTSLSGLSTWRTDKVTTMFNTFADDSAITSLDPLTPTYYEEQDYWSWNMAALSNMRGAFYNLKSAPTLEGLRNWTTPKLSRMDAAFQGMSSVTTLEPLSNWLPEGNIVSNLGVTFAEMSSIQNLHGLENWDTRNVSNVGGLFSYMYNLNDLSALMDWNTSKFNGLHQLFRFDRSLTNLNGLQNWNVESVIMIYEMFYGCSSLTDFTAVDSWEGTLNLDGMAGYNKSFVFSGVPDGAVLPIWWQ